MSFSHGAKWKTLISTYIGTMPLNAEVWEPAEQDVSCTPLPSTAVSAAMTAKVGVAPKDSQSSARRAASLSWRDAGSGK
jgi:predicted cobalt transporter CbtA